ncbi:polysaccharide pyruvyl transferase family protein [Escherichia coli]|uniref:polysaccharide pyruvyl transferase family protein n=7 Tax=Escherichia coli TaxID=562 RepID=UPI0010AC14FD|nr:polysaccharide pyruvyl transferase family protein [Escherichia coli]TJJ59400.1 polysaccharide pyruvyl transferase family protein [Escherichia coli]
MSKKVGIVTLPLVSNYGGILQCLALNFVLRKLGYKVTLIDIKPRPPVIKGIILNILSRCPFQNIKGIREQYVKEKKNENTISKYINNRTGKITDSSGLEKAFNNLDLDAVIVGSDQVWRYEYINNDMYAAYFLNFVKEKKCKKISYAASFGVDNWNHENKRSVTQKLLSQFDAISVREISGVQICNNEFAVKNVEHVLDPTMLDLTFYDELLDGVNEKKEFDKKYLLKYVLDEKDIADNISLLINKKYGLSNEVNILGKGKNYSIEEWVLAFKKATYIVTDSFHGMVFSILFNKNFIVIGNKSRGLSRFVSLLGKLDLLDRLFYPEEIINNKRLIEILHKDIDYCNVNELIKNWRGNPIRFLKTNLNEISYNIFIDND